MTLQMLEPNIIEISKGPRVRFNSAKMFSLFMFMIFFATS